jgi:hypothetical protein
VTHLSLPFAFRRALSCTFVISATTITGCGRADETPRVDTGGPGPGPRPTLAACDPPWSGGIESVSRDSVLSWAGRLSFTPRDTTRGRLYGFPEGAELNLTEGLDPAGLCLPQRRGCIIARVTTRAPQPDLRIPAGTSYVWADSVGGSARAVIIPTDPAAPVVVHTLGHHRFTLGGAPPTRAIGPGACSYCGDTCWCFWPTVAAAPSILRLRGDTGLVRAGTPRP